MVNREGTVLGRTVELLHHRGSDYPVNYIWLIGYLIEELLTHNRKWEERIAYFSSTRSPLFDTSRKKQTSVCMRNEFNKIT
jgi:hypothetical protein